MKLGMVMAVRNHPDRSYAVDEVYRDYLDDAVYADTELGFDHVWVNEHHLSADQYAPSVFPILAAIAARTSRIRIGTAVCLLPIHNPIRVSEDAATVDIISGGRLDLGVAAGVAQKHEMFGVRHEQAWKRSWEAADLIRRTFEEDVVDFDGEFYRYEGLRQTTKPVQKRVPIWWGGFGPQSLTRAARRGYHLIGCASDVFTDGLVAAGKDVAAYQVGQITGIHIAPTREQAWDEAQHGIHWWMQFHRLNTGLPAGMSSAGPLPDLPPAEQLRQVDGLTFLPGIPCYVGSPDDVLQNLLADCAGRHGRVTQLALAFRHAGMRTPEVRRSMDLFRTEILPNLP